jgi:hypothetical protein
MSAALSNSSLFVVEEPGQDLARKTVCIKVQRSRLGNSRKVSTSQVEVDTDKSMLRVSKRLFDCPQFKAIVNFDAEIGRYLETVCLPFEKSVHLCPLAMLEQIESRLREFAEQRPQLVEEFLEVYPTLCDQSPTRFRALHDPTDFLPLHRVRAAFSFGWRYISFGVPDKLREISPSLWEDERNKVAQLMTDAASEAQQVMRAVMAELVEHLAARLQDTGDGKPGRFHKSTVSKLLDFLDTFDFRNVADDAELKGLVEQARALMEGVTVKDLKSTTQLRDRVRTGMGEIATKLDTLVVYGGRKIRFDE